jgi:hypothetical protein
VEFGKFEQEIARAAEKSIKQDDEPGGLWRKQKEHSVSTGFTGFTGLADKARGWGV